MCQPAGWGSPGAGRWRVCFSGRRRWGGASLCRTVRGGCGIPIHQIRSGDVVVCRRPDRRPGASYLVKTRARPGRAAHPRPARGGPPRRAACSPPPATASWNSSPPPDSQGEHAGGVVGSDVCSASRRSGRFRAKEPPMRRVILVGLTVLALVGAAGPAGAITYGAPDGNAHPEVGALLAPQAYPDGTWATCSGTLISPMVFLTAAHCDQGVARVAVTFDASYDPRTGTTYWGSWHADPGYNQSQDDPQDMAVVVLDKAVRRITPARLPAAGSLGGLSGAQQFTSVGYGAQAVTNG